ncbi:helix-turn-helix transcriptional regulator [Brucella anthropi]|uniref:Helix-turn-helix transcriptional regulator n=2 Tax=Brucella anthropi TaxID=529 RepID=A0A6L3Z3I8_BRUAN|nr:helix-turn-helix transcriptional regulator [Brucella anthropi]KAB2774824.1 helix-turn-helix transcriptional regulator [Brucella anthropi]
MITGRQIAAARTLIGITQKELADASSISIPTLKRMEASEGEASGMKNNVSAVVQALIDMGVVFIPQNGGGYGVRLRDRQL